MSALPFDGLTVIITGDADGLTRDKANEAIARLGGKPVSSVSGKTGLVIIGEGAGVSKMAKTRQHKLNVIDAPAFLALISAVDNGTWDGQPVGEPVADYEARTDPEPEPDPDPALAVPFAERHLVGRASNFVKVPTATGSKVIGHYRLLCLKCEHKWLQRLTDDREACPVGAGEITTPFTGDWADLDVTAVAPIVVDPTKPPLPTGARPSRPAPARRTWGAPTADQPDHTADDVPEDPYDTFDPYDDPTPTAPATAPSATSHPGGDW